VNFFEPLPLPPQPTERRWAPPAWDRPSEGTLPATLPVDALLRQGEQARSLFPTWTSFPTGSVSTF
jgi:hypothetical protein